MTRFNKFTSELSKDTPLKVAYKNESFLMKLIGFILFFNRGFMTDYVTTVGQTVYYPSKQWVDEHVLDSVLVMAHEYVHVKDSIRMGFKYKLMYLLPQILAVFSLLSVLAFITPWFLVFLGFLLFLLPIPSPGRKYIELRGYKMSIYILYLLFLERGYSLVEISSKLYDNAKIMDTYFSGPAYYYMWPHGILNDLNIFISKILVKEPEDHEYQKVKEAFIASLT